MSKSRICVVSGTRAEYGLLYWLMKGLQDDHELELQLVATGMHLSPEFGMTYRTIESDGFKITAKVEMLLSSDTPVGIAKSIGLGVLGFADTFDQLNPDLLVVLGDRFEILAAVQAALPRKLPVAHIAGGDSTEGAMDEAIRHSITKMSHLHFVTNDVAARRVQQLGENPDYVFNVGSPGIDQIKRIRLLSQQELEAAISFCFREKNVLVTFHPTTLDAVSPADQFKELLVALGELGSSVGIIFTRPNADTDGRILNRLIDQFVDAHENSTVHTSLGQEKYLSALALCDVVIGNSSSGLYEAPSFKTAIVNIGDRQKGRIQAESVINCPAESGQILRAIQAAFVADCSDVINPYGDGESSAKILSIIRQNLPASHLVRKPFFDMSISGIE